MASCSSRTTPCTIEWSCRSACAAGLVVEQQDGAVALREEVLQRQHLAAVAQRVLRQQAQLGQAVDHHPHRRRSRPPRAKIELAWSRSDRPRRDGGRSAPGRDRAWSRPAPARRCRGRRATSRGAWRPARARGWSRTSRRRARARRAARPPAGTAWRWWSCPSPAGPRRGTCGRDRARRPGCRRAPAQPVEMRSSVLLDAVHSVSHGVLGRMDGEAPAGPAAGCPPAASARRKMCAVRVAWALAVFQDCYWRGCGPME